MRVSRRTFELLVDRALADIPPALARYLDNVLIELQDKPDEDTLREMAVDDPTELLGLYLGVPMTQRSVEGVELLPDRIVIYQRNIERISSDRADLVEQIRTTVLHEIGHHFGLDEQDLDDVGYG